MRNATATRAYAWGIFASIAFVAMLFGLCMAVNPDSRALTDAEAVKKVDDCHRRGLEPVGAVRNSDNRVLRVWCE